MMLTLIAFSMQGHRAGHHHDWPTERRQNIASEGTGGEPQFPWYSQPGSRLIFAPQGGEFTIEFVPPSWRSG